MPKFILSWTQTAHDDYGSDKEVTTGGGSLVVEADSREAVEAEIKKHAGAEVAYNEAVSITDIQEYAGSDPGKPLSVIGSLLNPYQQAAE